MTPGGPLVRPLRPDDDADALAAIVVAAYDALGHHDVDPEYQAELRDVRGRAEVATVVVAELDGALVGCLTFVPGPGGSLAEFDDEDAAGVRMFGVDPAVQGRGVGTAMMEWCRDEAVRLGRRRIVLHTTTDMATAKRMYERLGYTREPERDMHFDDLGLHLMAYVLVL